MRNGPYNRGVSGAGGFSAALTLPTGRMVLDLDQCSVQTCTAARPIVGEPFIAALSRFLNQPRRGHLELTSAVRDAVGSHRPTHAVLGEADAIDVDRAVLTVDPLSLPGRQVECFVVDYSPASGAVRRLGEHLVGILTYAPGSKTAHEIGHIADLYLIDDLSAYSILRYIKRGGL